MSPELCARIAEIPNIVGIKYSVPREMYVELTHLTRSRLIVSTAAEEEWLDNILELDWQVYLCSSPPYLLQSAVDRRMRRAEQDRFIRGERPVRTVDGRVLALDRSEDPRKRFSAVTGGHAAVELVERPFA